MKRTLGLLVLLLTPLLGARAEITVVQVRGEVDIRRGVDESWSPARPGDLLKPEDSMRSGKRSSALILIDDETRLTMPADVIIDMSDLRNLTREELLLKLAMERVRSVPAQERNGEFTIPKTTTVHGSNRSPVSITPMPVEDVRLRLNGAKFLFEHRYYATSVLRIKSILRSQPGTEQPIDMRFMMAAALEQMGLDGEALSEYRDLAGGNLSPSQRSLLEQNIARLKHRNGE